MRFAAPIAGCVHGKWKLEYDVVWHLTSLRQATELREMIWKIFFAFDFHILPLQRHIGARIVPCRCIKKNLPRWPIYLFTGNESKPPVKL